MSQFIQRLWYRQQLHPLLWPLLPLTLLFWFISSLRRSAYQLGILTRYRAPVPVIVVGNITLGGTGKTPMVEALCAELKRQDFTPGIISRGYGAKAQTPFSVAQDDSSEQAGDEPLLLRRRTGCPVVIDKKRSNAVEHLLHHHPEVDVIVSDDGLQHYHLARDVEIIVLDADRGVGNGWLLPCGPLREGAWRLHDAPWVIANNAQHPFARYVMELEALPWRRVIDDQESPPESPLNVVAVAGIGHPQRFFRLLEQQGHEISERLVFRDHYPYKAGDFARFNSDDIIVMTEKDAGKCQKFAGENWFYLPIRATLPEQLTHHLATKIERKENGNR
ncbi:tetraacyldisaccharide 4'-kinase [Idiomarina tyrosinivorans]|uniref:Tetraacyldisaccharide 4'-kinase n=1 Tax=Idiomarina tyrosinivorans TaxID=1445662 RepID=A0A432ZUH2_9GAMM|nr:tetraacyldisaccharide 4'-kinase [Idiomarina tyrosinivorans]RUO81501.1 tetraacyldisaccharide 4'-kinase [Idiomarina tyrosinivorans]